MGELDKFFNSNKKKSSSSALGKFGNSSKPLSSSFNPKLKKRVQKSSFTALDEFLPQKNSSKPAKNNSALPSFESNNYILSGLGAFHKKQLNKHNDSALNNFPIEEPTDSIRALTQFFQTSRGKNILDNPLTSHRNTSRKKISLFKILLYLFKILKKFLNTLRFLIIRVLLPKN